MNPKLLAIDFDGVIVDSVFECAVSGFNAYQESQPFETMRVIKKDQIPKDILKNFLSLRHFIRNSEDYVYIYEMIYKGYFPKTQNEFDSYLESRIDNKKRYNAFFNYERNLLLNKDRIAWMELNPFYKGLKEQVKRFSESENFYIVSTKNPEFIKGILNFHNIQFDISKIFYGGGDLTKKDVIKSLILEKNIKSEQVAFIDDHLGILISIKELGVNCMLATWGYNSYSDKDQANRLNMKLLALNDISAIRLD